MPFYVEKTLLNLTHWAFKQLWTKSLYSRRTMMRRIVSFSARSEEHGAARASVGRRTLLLLHVGEVFKREGSYRGSPESVGLHDGLQASPDRHKQTDKLFQNTDRRVLSRWREHTEKHGVWFRVIWEEKILTMWVWYIWEAVVQVCSLCLYCKLRYRLTTI